MDTVSFSLFVFVGLFIIFMLYKFAKYASQATDGEQKKKRNGLHD